jgi:hypothetical protein
MDWIYMDRDWDLWFTSTEPEIGIRRIAANKDYGKLKNVGLYLRMYKEKWKMSVIKCDDEVDYKLGLSKDQR